MLLDVNNEWPRDTLDEDAIGRAIARNPQNARRTHRFSVPNTHSEGEAHPLFMAVAVGASLDLVKTLYEAYPKAIEVTTAGMTPLHCALISNDWRSRPDNRGEEELLLEMVGFLIEEYPQALTIRTSIGRNTPLHFACTSCAPFEILRLLAEKYPGAVNARNNKRLTPLDIVFRNIHRYPVEVSDMLRWTYYLNAPGLKLGKRSILFLLKNPLFSRSFLGIGDGAVPQLLFRIGKDCDLETMQQAVKCMTDLFSTVQAEDLKGKSEPL
eukprot:CAMPEP_0197445794 /NCGR_PEP_ID=MMETSP1175-20131217/10924_1 /TAXON_ID=1003142 /ORGANISM="Triceratium dubium, Strain CCMP147" /LENGTH=267 /DNA_ID=CAMNT_0042976811 /DNA_START=320 /DNA_END=1123 /DNA_ORIENTATION=+